MIEEIKSIMQAHYNWTGMVSIVDKNSKINNEALLGNVDWLNVVNVA